MDNNHHSPHSHSITTSIINISSHLSQCRDAVGAGSTANAAGARYKLISPAKLPISSSACIIIPPGLSPTSSLESALLFTNVEAEHSPTTGSLFKPQMMQRLSGTAAFSSGSRFQLGEPTGQSATNWDMASPKDSSTYTPHEEANGLRKFNDHRSAIQVDSTSDDGYSWRKYGQKVVKGSECPRSYYKCTHPNCEVKKILERSYTTGQIREIVYKGTHSHPKPQPSRRFSAGTLMSVQEEDPDTLQYGNYQAGLSANNGQNPNLDDSGTPLQSQRQANQERRDEDDDDDQNSKKRRTDIGTCDITPVVKPIREPRVVVQTTSEVDILDDGYRWRKYGQKVVRCNPNPRSYYKCKSVGCTVRKHVERASHDPKAVITAYEGKHNHDVPVVKTNNHDLTGFGHQRASLEDNDAVCLDLLVGSTGTHLDQPQAPNPSTLHSQVHVSNSNFRKVIRWNVVCGFREHDVEGCNNDIRTTLNNRSSNPYPQNPARIVSGPVEYL